MRGAGEAEVGLGLAEALGLRPGSTLAVQLRGGARRASASWGSSGRSRTTGRVAYVRPDRLLAGDPALSPRSSCGSTPAPTAPRRARAARARRAAAARRRATTRSGAFLAVLADLLRVVGRAVRLVCLYALVRRWR